MLPPSRYKTLLNFSALSIVVAALSGCGEDVKDCGGFWDNTFGREACASTKVTPVKSISVTPPVVKANVVAIDAALQSKLSVTYLDEGVKAPSEAPDVLLALDNSNNDFSNIKLGSVLVIEQNTKLPVGMAAKVVSLQALSNNKLQAELEYVPLTDIFDSLNIYGDSTNRMLDAPVFYPAKNITYNQPQLDQVTGVKSFSLPNVPKNTVTIDPLKWDANKKEAVVGGKIALSFEMIETNEGRKIRLKENCDKSQYACLTGEIPFNTTLSDAKEVQPLAVEINDGKLVKYQSGFQAKVSSTIGLKIATGKKMGGVPFQLSLADMLQAFWGGTQGTGKSVQDKVGVGGFEFSGVPYEDDKIILGTLVFKPIQAALTLGSTGIEIQASGRNVTFQPALLVTLFMNVKGEVKAEVSAEYALPKYQFNSLTNLSIDYNKINLPFTETDFEYPTGVKDVNTTSSFNKIKEDDNGTLKLEAAGEASLTSSMGLDVGLSFLNITPVNSSAEVGGKIKAAGALKWATGESFEGCISGIQLGIGARMFVDIQTGVKTPSKDFGWIELGGGTEFAYRWNILNADKDNKDWALQKVLWQLGEDTCHKPVISAANWLGGDFVNNQYPMEFDASSTRYTPYIDSMTWDFGDGTTKKIEEDDVIDNLKIKHVYSKIGKYTANLKVKYKDEKEVTVSYDLVIEQPAAAIDHYPATGLAGVIGISPTSVEGGLKSYDIDWGDGKKETFTMTDKDALHRHTYASEGEKKVLITLRDNFGSVFQELRTISPKKSLLTIEGGNAQKVGQPVIFKIEQAFSDAKSVLWQFFNGLGNVIKTSVAAISDKITWAFDSVADYKVTAELRDANDTAIDSMSSVINVSLACPSGQTEQGGQCVAASISQVTPLKAVADQKMAFTLTGANLSSSVNVSLADCADLQKTSTTATQIKFECTPKVMGDRALQVKDQAGNVLWNANITFEYIPIQPAQPTVGFSYIVDPLSFMNQTMRYSFSYWSVNDPVQLASYSVESASDVNKFAMSHYATSGGSSNVWRSDPKTSLEFSLTQYQWIESNGSKQASEGIVGTSGVKTAYITDDFGVQYYTLLERDLSSKTLAEGLTTGFGDGRQLPTVAYTATFSNGAKAYTWIRDVLTPTYSINRTHYIFSSRNDPFPVYTCVNIGSCSNTATSLSSAIAQQAWIRNGGNSGSVRLKAGNQAELLVTDPVTRVNSMYIINYQLVSASTDGPARVVFSTIDVIAKKALADYFGINDDQLALYEYNGQVVRGTYTAPIKGQVSQSYTYNKAAINDILTKWSPAKAVVLE